MAGQKYRLYPVKSLDHLTLCLVIYVSNGKSNSKLLILRILDITLAFVKKKKKKGAFFRDTT